MFSNQHLTSRARQQENLARFQATMAEENSILKDNYRLQCRELQQEINEKDATIGDLRRQLANMRNQVIQERLQRNVRPQ